MNAKNVHLLIATLALCVAGTSAGEEGRKQTAMGSGEMFDAIAPRYDLINNFLSLGMHRWWRSRMVAALDLQPGNTVLDLGTGTADVAIEVARNLKKKMDGGALASDAVVGVDPSHNMLAHGRVKVAAAGFHASAVRLVQGDAQDLSQTLKAQHKFDAATMAFAIRNVPDRLKALKSIASHLKPGARFAVLELGEPTFPPARWFVRYCVPFIGAMLSGGARAEYQHLEKSVLNFHSNEFAVLIKEAGLTLTSVRMMNFGAVGLYVAQLPVESAAAPAAAAASPPAADEAVDAM
mmetsp:Transcript_27241/g.43716  ORF Transcript_27241/g.43716 Transcript_27241/m.43716 type:complete len:293 (-) Transcript_27241:99-977(-)